jgi:hypothetical protein
MKVIAFYDGEALYCPCPFCNHLSDETFDYDDSNVTLPMIRCINEKCKAMSVLKDLDASELYVYKDEPDIQRKLQKYEIKNIPNPKYTFIGYPGFNGKPAKNYIGKPIKTFEFKLEKIVSVSTEMIDEDTDEIPLYPCNSYNMMQPLVPYPKSFDPLSLMESGTFELEYAIEPGHPCTSLVGKKIVSFHSG